MRLVIAALLIVATSVITAQAPVGDGVVTATASRWTMNEFGDHIIVTDVNITDNKGGHHFITVEGGKAGDVELFVSETPRFKPGQRVRLRGNKATPVEQDAVIFGRWRTPPVPYYVNTNSVRLTPEASLNAIAFAANVWSEQSQANISTYYAGSTPGDTVGMNYKSEVFFRVDPDTSYAGKALLWSENGYFVDGDIVFNESYLFLAGDVPCDRGVYVEDIGAHEFGHFLGLSHTDVTTATMYPTTSYCSQSWRVLDPDDIYGIETNYPPVNPDPEPDPEPETLTVSTTPYKVKGRQHVDVRWAGFSSSVDIYRSSTRIATGTANDGFYTDVIGNRGGGSYLYRVCETNTTVCSESIAVF